MHPFVSLALELSSILSFSHTPAHLQYCLGILGASLDTLDLDKEGKGMQVSATEQVDQEIHLDRSLGNRLHV